MQQIVGSGRTILRYERFSLCLSGLCAPDENALRLSQVCVNAADIPYELCDTPCGIELSACIPLLVTLCDRCGCSYTAHSSITVPVQLRQCRNHHDLQCGRFYVSASVRLARGGACVCDQCVDACLDVCVEAWQLVSRPVCAPDCAPACPPPLPLYPQPQPFPYRD